MIHIEVTAEHIANGERRSGGGCPVALAVNEALWSYYDVAVSPRYVSLHSNRGKSFCAPLPRNATKFIDAFDAGLLVEPMAFDLEVPA